MVDDVLEIVRRQPIVDRYQHGADLRDGVIRFQMRVGIGRDIGDPVAVPDAEGLKR